MPWSKCTLQDALTSNGVFTPLEKQLLFKNDNPAKFEETILTGAVGEKKKKMILAGYYVTRSF
jgi:hypothetical protein